MYGLTAYICSYGHLRADSQTGTSTAALFLTGSEALGGALMLLFFATIGAGAGSLSALGSTGWLTAFIAIQLSVHLAVIIVGGYVIARLPMQVVLCSCMSTCVHASLRMPVAVHYVPGCDLSARASR